MPNDVLGFTVISEHKLLVELVTHWQDVPDACHPTHGAQGTGNISFHWLWSQDRPWAVSFTNTGVWTSPSQGYAASELSALILDVVHKNTENTMRHFQKQKFSDGYEDYSRNKHYWTMLVELKRNRWQVHHKTANAYFSWHSGKNRAYLWLLFSICCLGQASVTNEQLWICRRLSDKEPISQTCLLLCLEANSLANELLPSNKLFGTCAKPIFSASVRQHAAWAIKKMWL